MEITVLPIETQHDEFVIIAVQLPDLYFPSLTHMSVTVCEWQVSDL